MLAAVDAAADAWSADHVGIRISPMAPSTGSTTPTRRVCLHLATEFSRRDLAFLHLSEPDWAGGPAIDDEFRNRPARGLHRPYRRRRQLRRRQGDPPDRRGLIDAAAFGRPFIANPDLPRRLGGGLPLNPQRPESFYGGDGAGYTDYPPYGAA